MNHRYFSVLLVIFGTRNVAGLDCFVCKDVTDIKTCSASVPCHTNEACYQDSTLSGQTTTISMGCIDNARCRFETSSAGALVGREVIRRQDGRCHECCSTDLCNDILCARRRPTSCIDDETVDCPRLESVFGICKDIHHAKTVCPKFCNLCDLVDGAWSEWTSWSACDVTCDNGTMSRVRTCTNPKPVHGGLNCTGNDAEIKPCHKRFCPVHGGWSEWEHWGLCSSTCDVGIQSRHRTCTNPVPQWNGNQCFGISHDTGICLPKACADGNWSGWGLWSSCSVTCGNGFQTRSRNCTDPAPSLSGRQCIGDDFEVYPCKKTTCDPVVAFVATLTHSVNCSIGDAVIFDRLKLNQGSAYNISTGNFIVPESGTYHLGLTLMSKANGKGFTVGIRKNGKIYIGYLYVEMGTHWQQRSTSVIATLEKDDSITVTCARPSSFYGSPDYNVFDFNSHFSGYRIGPN